MQIALVKKECNNGDKVTISGTVKWCGPIKPHQGQDGEFHTQSLLVADGIKTDNNANSLFCGFYVKNNEDFTYLKDKSITLQGTINIYVDKDRNNKMELRSCKLHETVDSSQRASIQEATDSLKPPQNTQQGPQQPAQDAKEEKEVDWDAKDLRNARMNGLNNATALTVLLAEMLKREFSSNDVKNMAAEFVDYIYNGIKTSSLPNNYEAANREMDEVPSPDDGNSYVNPDDNTPPY